MADLILDVFLVLAILSLAVLCLAGRDLLKSIVLFICMGLLVTITWVRLDAWDVAIAEAAIGAGITGALLLVTLRNLQSSSRQSLSRESEDTASGEDHV